MNQDDNMLYLGIDNGIAGGLASYDADSGQLNVIAMPIVGVKTAKGNKNEYDIPAIIEWIRSMQDIGIPKMVILEKAQAFPGQGVVSMFGIGQGYGLMKGIIAALGLPYMVVAPKTWQKEMFKGMPQQDTKQASVLTAQRLFPQTRFVGTERSKKLHNGMTDAALMAYYGYLLHK